MDFNNYKDANHYAQWINSLILRWMQQGRYQLTVENYKAYLAEEMDNYLNYDYTALNGQVDYESDFYAAALLNEELTGVTSIKLLDMPLDEMHLLNASAVTSQHDGKNGILCTGSLKRESGSDMSVMDYIQNNEYVGARVKVNNVDDYGYLVFYGKKVSDHGQPTVFVLNDKNEKVGELSATYNDIDNEWHQYVIDITQVKGGITIFFNGGYIDSTGSNESEYIFSDIVLY